MCVLQVAAGRGGGAVSVCYRAVSMCVYECLYVCCRSWQAGEEEQCQCVIEQCLCVSMSVYVCVAGRGRPGRRSSVSRRGRATCCSGPARVTTQPSPTTSQVMPSNRHIACTGTLSWTTSQVTPSNRPQALDVNALAISWDDKLWTWMPWPSVGRSSSWHECPGHQLGW